MANTTFNTTPQPQQTLGGMFSSLGNMNQQIKSSPILNPTSSTPIPVPQNSGMSSSNASMASTGTNSGLGAFNSTTTNNGKGGTSTKPTPNPSVLEQQKSLNQQNVNTPGYVPLVEDGLAGPKTSAALAQYGYNTTTGQPNTPKTTTPPVSTDTTATTTPVTPPVGAGGAATGGANNGSTGVNQGVLIGNLANQSQTQSPAYTNAVNKYNTVAGQLEALKAQEAQQTSDINQSGTWTSRALGEQGQANIQNASTEAALGSQLTAEGNVINAANTQQGLQVQAGSAAANANAPVSQFGVLTSPATGNPVNGQSAQQAAITGGTTQGLQAAAQSNAQVSGTATTNAANTGLQSSINNYVSANTAYSTATQQSKNLQSTMASTGINTNPQFANQTINALQNQLGSANYTSFITALSEAQQAYTSLLSSVGAATPTVNGQQATNIFNPNSTPSQINAAIDALNTAAYAKLQPLYNQIGTYASQLGGKNSTSTSTSGFGWNG